MRLGYSQLQAGRDLTILMNPGLQHENTENRPADSNNVDRFGSWYVKKRSTHRGGVYPKPTSTPALDSEEVVVERTIDVVTAKVDPASPGSDSNEVDVAYGMTVRVNRDLEVCRAIWKPESIYLTVT
jgi:hypothetical protein